MIFIIGWCHRSLAGVTPANYERDIEQVISVLIILRGNLRPQGRCDIGNLVVIHSKYKFNELPFSRMLFHIYIFLKMYIWYWCCVVIKDYVLMRDSTVLLCGGFTGHQWIPRTKANDAVFWCFLWSGPEPTVEQTKETPVIWDAIALTMRSL